MPFCTPILFFGFLSFFFSLQIGGLTTARLMTKICFILLLDTVVLVSWELVDPLQSEFTEISKEVLKQKMKFSEIREYGRFKFIFLRVTLA